MKKIILFSVLLIVFLICPVFVGDIFGQPPPPPAEQIPIDGGLTALIAAGIAYGARKLYKERKANK